MHTTTPSETLHQNQTNSIYSGGDREDFANNNPNAPLMQYSVQDETGALQIRYNYGDYCNATGSAENRRLTILMLCNPAITEIEEGTTVILAGPDVCNSQLEIQSVYGCPVTEIIPTTDFNETEPFPTFDFSTTDDIDINETDYESTESMDTSTSSTETGTTAYDEEYWSVYGTWSDYDEVDNELYGVELGVNLDCTKMKIIMYSPAGQSWFGFGIGGDYEHHSSEDVDTESYGYTDASASEADVMNGYAIISTPRGTYNLFFVFYISVGITISVCFTV